MCVDGGSKRSQGRNEGRGNLSKRLTEVSFCHNGTGIYKDTFKECCSGRSGSAQDWSTVVGVHQRTSLTGSLSLLNVQY